MQIDIYTVYDGRVNELRYSRALTISLALSLSFLTKQRASCRKMIRVKVQRRSLDHLCDVNHRSWDDSFHKIILELFQTDGKNTSFFFSPANKYVDLLVYFYNLNLIFALIF